MEKQDDFMKVSIFKILVNNKWGRCGGYVKQSIKKAALK